MCTILTQSQKQKTTLINRHRLITWRGSVLSPVHRCTLSSFSK